MHCDNSCQTEEDSASEAETIGEKLKGYVLNAGSLDIEIINSFTDHYGVSFLQ